jgi:hypothetical protein
MGDYHAMEDAMAGIKEIRNEAVDNTALQVNLLHIQQATDAAVKEKRIYMALRDKDDHLCTFYEDGTAEDNIYCITASSVLGVFGAGKNVRVLDLSGNHFQAAPLWVICPGKYSFGCLKIGCHRFGIVDSKKIRRWAEKYRR